MVRSLSLSPLILCLVLSVSCASVRKMPHETFAKIPPDSLSVTPDCVKAGLEELESMARWQKAEARDVVLFWQDAATIYEPYLEQSPTPDRIDAMVGALVEHYADYIDRASVRAELLGVNWPYGLLNIHLKKGAEPGSAAAPPDAHQGLAGKAWPRWVARAEKPSSILPRFSAQEHRDWARTYAANRREILTFWLSVSLTVQRQFAYIRSYETTPGDRPYLSSPDNRPPIPLPLIEDYNSRLLESFALFSRFPIFRKDYDRFREVGGEKGCRIPPAEPYAFAEGWSIGLLSKGSANHWLATGRVGQEGTAYVSPALVRQRGSGWFLFPAIGWGMGAVDRFAINSDGTAGPAHRRAEGFTVWPLLLYAKGAGLTTDGYEVEGMAYGIPLIYATAGFKNDHGTRYRMREALHFLLYWGEDVHTPSDSRSTHAWLMGALWYSHYNDRAGRSLNGPLWGAFGWGHRRGEPVYRVFGLPIERQP